MAETAVQPSITTTDMVLTGETLVPEQKEAFSRLINWQPGQLLLIHDRYRIERYLGRGGFGLVFAAYDEREEITVAVKFIHPCQTQSERQRRRIEREFDIAQKLRHPRLVRLYRFEEWQKIHYMIMDFIPGRTCSDWIQEEGPQAWRVIGPLVMQLVEVLSSIHRAGAVHRDIKPSNLVIHSDGNLVLLDLGLTREISDTQKTSSTGELVGSPHYLPPELILGQKATPASDLYQFGLVVHYMLTGSHPFTDEEKDTASVLGRQLTQTLRLSKKLELPRQIRRFINSCLDKEPSMRPRDAMELARLLDRRGRLARLRRYLQLRRPLRFALLTGLGVLGLFFFLLYMVLPFHHISEMDQVLIARNALGRELWRKSPGEREMLAGWIQGRDATGRMAVSAVYAPGEPPYRFNLDTIRPDHFPIVRRVWDSRGSNRFMPDNPIDYGYLDYFDFYPLAELNQLLRRDIDRDGQPEMILISKHAGGMFPTLMTVFGLDKFPRMAFFSPGLFSLKEASETSSILGFRNPEKEGLLTLSNPLCHYHIWAWNLKTEQFLGNLAIPPSFSDISGNFLKTTQLIVLPSRSWVTRNDWNEKSEVELSCADSQLTLTVQQSGRVIISGRTNQEFTENFPANSAALSMINRVYYHVVRQEADKALQTAGQIVDRDIRNPWLRSVIAYFRGEAFLIAGRGDPARSWYHRALVHDPFNTDAKNRLSELEVTENGPLQGLMLHQSESRYAGSFWGLGVHGQAIFQICCRLMAGQPYTVSQVQQLVNTDLSSSYDMDQFTRNYQGLTCLYSRNRTDLSPVISRLLEEYSTQTILPFDISELQLFLARLWLVNGERSRAEPLFLRYATQTVLHKPYAETSLAWCEAETGHHQAARERAERAFNLLRHMAKTQFWARYWLFYDAYAFGRTMEILGEKTKAREGFRLCAELAPNSFLASEARSRD